MWGIISIVFGIIELGIGLRFIFELLGADPSYLFVTWTYNLTQPLVAPFSTFFGHVNQPVAGVIPSSVFDPAALIALVVYGLIGGILLRIIARPRAL